MAVDHFTQATKQCKFFQQPMGQSQKHTIYYDRKQVSINIGKLRYYTASCQRVKIDISKR